MNEPHEPFDEMMLRIRRAMGLAPKLGRATPDEVTTFTRQIAAMLVAGVNAAEVLRFYSAGSTSYLGKVSGELYQMVASGQTLSSAMRSYPNVFSAVYVGMVEVGEESNALGPALSRLASLLERQQELRKKVVSTLTYPCLVLFISGGCLGFFVFIVLPLLIPLFQNVGVGLPLPTRILLSMRYLVPLTIYLVLWAAIVRWLADPYLRSYFRRRPEVKQKLAGAVLRIPLAGPLLDKMLTARVLHSLSTVMAAGIPVVSAFERCAMVVGNALYEARILEATDLMRRGSSVYDACTEQELFSRGARQMLQVGEESASLPRLLHHTARMFEDEVDMALTNLTSLLEPLLMSGMGLVVGLVVVGSVLPTVALINNL